MGPEAWGSHDWASYFPIGPQVGGVAIKTPLSYEGQLAEVQFKFCAPDALAVTSLTEEQILSTKGDNSKLASLTAPEQGQGSKATSWPGRLRCTGREVSKDQQPWFLKKFEKDFDGTFFKSAGSSD